MNMRNGAANSGQIADIRDGHGHIFHGANQTNPAAPVFLRGLDTQEPADADIWDSLGPSLRVGTGKKQRPDRFAPVACARTKSRGRGIRFRYDIGPWEEFSVISFQSSVCVISFSAYQIIRIRPLLTTDD